ncbi:MAG TPA: DUF1326 domain-containing protein [Tepidiformaceae bacterium]|nr:DUF1326 domain-containing protein [Tepidiformaceae bacterium]
MAWNVEGTYFENCSCEVLCPCITSPMLGPADEEYCHATLAFHVNRGQADGTDLSGRSVILMLDAPQMMSAGNWRVGVVVDDQATDQQSELIQGIFAGQMGGPMAGFAPLIGEILGVERAPIEWSESGPRHRLKAGSLVEMEIADFIPEGASEPMKLTGAPHPANSTLTIAKAESHRVRAFGFEWDQAGRNGHSAPFAWSA